MYPSLRCHHILVPHKSVIHLAPLARTSGRGVAVYVELAYITFTLHHKLARTFGLGNRRRGIQHHRHQHAVAGIKGGTVGQYACKQHIFRCCPKRQHHQHEQQWNKQPFHTSILFTHVLQRTVYFHLPSRGRQAKRPSWHRKAYASRHAD